MAVATAAHSGSFSVSPVRVYMQARDRATAVTVQNEGDTDLVMQAELFEWKQAPDGTEQLTATDDMVMAPPVLKLKARSQQVIRLANLKPPPAGQQLTYRLFVREVPEALTPAAGVQVQVALAFSIPVFLTPQGAKSQLGCSVQGKTAQALLVACENTGQAYAQPLSLAVTGAAGTPPLTQEIAGGYILPGITRTFEMKAEGRALPRGPAKLTVSQDDGSKQTFEITVPQ